MNLVKTHAAQAQFWKPHIDSWMDKNCGLTQSEYCLRFGLTESAFSKWKSRFYPKLKRSKIPTKKSQCWAAAIKSWRGKKQTQAHYCYIQQISEASFSKWKKKLHPKLAGKARVAKAKNRYVAYSRLTNQDVEQLIRGVLKEVPAKKIAAALQISEKTACKYYRRIINYLMVGATQYPALFSGAGLILFFGPPPAIRDLIWDKYRYSSWYLGTRKFLNILKKTLIYQSHFNWSQTEAWYFYMQGWSIYYRIIYTRHTDNPPEFTSDIHNRMRIQVMEGSAIEELWNFYFENKSDLLIVESVWKAIYHNRSYDDSPKYYRNMIADIEWVMKNHSPLKRSEYWDDLKPDVMDIWGYQKSLHDLINFYESAKK